MLGAERQGMIGLMALGLLALEAACGGHSTPSLPLANQSLVPLASPKHGSTRQTQGTWETMTNPREGKYPWLDLSEETFFSFDEHTARELTHRLLLSPRYRGIAIGTPHRVDLALHSVIPLLFVTQYSGVRDWEVVGFTNRVLLVSDLERGDFRAVYLTNATKHRLPESLPQSRAEGGPAQDASRRMVPEVIMFDARRIIVPPLELGHFAFTVLEHDWITNTTVIEIIHGSSALSQENKRALQYPRAKATQVLTAFQGNGPEPRRGMYLGSSIQTPPVEGTEGMAVVVPTHSPSEGAAIPVHGRLKAELLWGSMVAPGNSPPGEAVPSAVIKLGVVLTGLDQMRPISTVVPIPVVGLLDPKPGDRAEVAFSLDLAAAMGGGIPKGIYQVYFACGKQVAGPYPLRIEGG